MPFQKSQLLLLLLVSTTAMGYALDNFDSDTVIGEAGGPVDIPSRRLVFKRQDSPPGVGTKDTQIQPNPKPKLSGPPSTLSKPKDSNKPGKPASVPPSLDTPTGTKPSTAGTSTSPTPTDGGVDAPKSPGKSSQPEKPKSAQEKEQDRLQKLDKQKKKVAELKSRLQKEEAKLKKLESEGKKEKNGSAHSHGSEPKKEKPNKDKTPTTSPSPDKKPPSNGSSNNTSGNDPSKQPPTGNDPTKKPSAKDLTAPGKGKSAQVKPDADAPADSGPTPPPSA
ncbi:hypothetical protein MJO28_010769 [Puccinia striiformis f. sp. tritici]|uniref:Secreted protein n=2 Tax=Puccinia striiformis TaxID=27350 RepID=A0A2S4VH13_9BASI|nr:hypothetical protein MJO28_010769 [Puccinia striiformis f. sp. tritici]KAI7948852.1 hypothetical protein MJO29_010517 [Puccinia striiformis f. sp. tritici]POW08834.1 hypothetical protein PSHT_09396 [Puccinia striiformis]